MTSAPLLSRLWADPVGSTSAARSHLNPLTLGSSELICAVGSPEVWGSKVKTHWNSGESGQSPAAGHKGCGWDGAKSYGTPALPALLCLMDSILTAPSSLLNEPLPSEESLGPGHFGVKSEQVARWDLRPAGEGLAELGGKEPRAGKERGPKGHEGTWGWGVTDLG